MEVVVSGPELTTAREQAIVDHLLTHASNARKVVVINNSGYLIVKPYLCDELSYTYFEILL